MAIIISDSSDGFHNRNAGHAPASRQCGYGQCYNSRLYRQRHSVAGASGGISGKPLDILAAIRVYGAGILVANEAKIRR